MRITLELDEAQAMVLRSTLRNLLSDMSVEIAGTDRRRYREEIKQEREVLRGVVAQLEAATASSEQRPE